MKITTFNNKLLSAVNRSSHNLYKKINSIVETAYLRFIGVKIQGGEFRGWTSVFLANDSIIEIGDGCAFNSNGYYNHIGLNHRCIITTMRQGAKIIIGAGTGISSSTITSWKSVYIGNNVRIGANCVIMDGDFHLDDPRVSDARPIIIESGVWLGANVVVLKGITIGKNTVIGMNSIVTKDIPENCIAAGNPCKVIRFINRK